MARILLTGATGLIGRNLLATLLADKENEVFITARPKENSLPKSSRCIYLCKDFRDIHKIDLLPSFDVAFHLAAISNTRDHTREELLEINYQASAALITWLADRGTPHIVYASSCALYGRQQILDERNSPDPQTAYAESKALLDEYISSRFLPANITGLRFSNVYGMGETHKGSQASIIHTIYQTLVSEKAIKLFAMGEHQRDWCYVNDAVQALILAGQHQGQDIFNIGSGIVASYNIIAVFCGKVFDGRDSVTIEYIPCPFPETYQHYELCKIDKAIKVLGYRPQYQNLITGISEYFDDLRTV